MDIKRFCLLLTIVLLLPLHSMAAETNLLQNTGFEQLDSNGMPKEWRTDAYRSTEGYTLFSVTEDTQNGSCVMIRSLALNDARFLQTVKVEPSSIYRLSGYVKASDVGTEGWGANLSVDGVYLNDVSSVYDSDGEWVYTEIYGKTGPKQKEITVYLRLGGYSGESQGIALFDNVSLVKVDTVPSDVLIENWYREEVSQPAAQQTTTEDQGKGSPFWPWLLCISAFYLIGGWLMIAQLTACKEHDLEDKQGKPVLLIIGLILAFLLRAVIAYRIDGYQVDVNCFVSWGYTMQMMGAGDFYQSNWCDYPPAYMLVLGFNSWCSSLLNNAAAALPDTLQSIFSHLVRSTMIIKLLPMLADLGIALLVYVMAKERRMRKDQASILSLLVAFCPVLIINSAAWCQVDSVMALLLMLVVYLALHHNWACLMPVYMLAVLMKPQSLMVGPLGLIVLVAEFIVADKDTRLHIRFKAPKHGRSMIIGLCAAVGVVLIVLLPFFFGSNGLHLVNDEGEFWLIKLYADTLASYPYATVNTTNLYYLFNGNWSSIEATASLWVTLILLAVSLGWGMLCGWRNRKQNRALWWAESALMALFAAAYILLAITGASWATIGFIAMGLAFAIVVPLYLRANRMELLPLMGGLLFLLLYVLGIKMHERYLFPAIVLFAAAFALHRDGRILVLMLLTACTMFVNEGIVLDNSLRLGSSMGHLNNDTYLLNMLLSAINVLSIPFALWICSDICLTEGPAYRFGLSHLPLTASYTQKPACLNDYQPDPRLYWRKLDTVMLIAITAVYSMIALWNLGSTKAPQTTWTSTSYGENIVLDLGKEYDGIYMLYYCQVSYNDFTVETSTDGENWSDFYWAEMNEGNCYRWKYLTPATLNYDGTHKFIEGSDRHYSTLQQLSGRYVRITAQQINLRLNEVIFRDADGQTIPVTLVSRNDEISESSLLSDPNAIIDEQDSLEGEPGWYTGTYFDEIYYTRTAKEFLDQSSPYEYTHPPLGKVFMSWMIALFGVTPFVWRLAGALAGILMLPSMYLLAKQLTKRTDMAVLASSMLAFDCMHYTQTRLATIDSYPVLFILLSYLFMVRFMQRDIVLKPIRTLLPDLALSGFFMGCGIASKWIGIYSAAGLAILYFWTLARHIRLWLEAKHAAANQTALTLAHTERISNTWLRLLILCLWCILFFIVVPAFVYALSYIPHLAYAKPANIIEFIQEIVRVQQRMFWYHSQSGFGADHIFSSPWYEWPTNTKPMYYAVSYFMPAGTSQAIFCFTNPVILWIGLAGFAITVCVWLKRHLYTFAGSELPIHLSSDTWDTQPAIVLIGLMAQYLPWIIVPRGTYIYHFFASIPFLILCATLCVWWLSQHMPQVARVLLILMILFSLAGFVICYPYASGMPTSLQWLDFIRNFLNVYYHL